MPLPTITIAPAAPSRSDAPEVFNVAADAFVVWQSAFPGEINAWSAALPAMVNGIDYNGTSTTSVAIATGSKTFTTQAGKNFQIGQAVRVAFTTTPANYMDGQVTAYNSTTGSITVNVSAVGGSGTYALWTISLAVSGAGFLPLSGGALTGGLSVAGDLSSAAVVSGVSPNTGTSGAVVIRDAAANPNAAYLQFTNNARTVNYAYVRGLSSGGLNLNGQVSVTSTAVTTTVPVVLGATGGTVAGSIGYTGGNLNFGNGSSQLTVVSTTGTQTLTNKTLTSPVINDATIGGGSTVTDTGSYGPDKVGFRGVPPTGNTSGTVVASDQSKGFYTSQNWTIPSNAAIPFGVGTYFVFFNLGATAITISVNTDELALVGTAITGSRTIAPNGECVVKKVSATKWLAGGGGTS